MLLADKRRVRPVKPVRRVIYCNAPNMPATVSRLRQGVGSLYLLAADLGTRQATAGAHVVPQIAWQLHQAWGACHNLVWVRFWQACAITAQEAHLPLQCVHLHTHSSAPSGVT